VLAHSTRPWIFFPSLGEKNKIKNIDAILLSTKVNLRGKGVKSNLSDFVISSRFQTINRG
jgi:hypothetical protein